MRGYGRRLPIFTSPFECSSNRISLLIGVLLTLASMALVISAGRVMKAAGTNVRPDRPSLTVVQAGPYRLHAIPCMCTLCLLQWRLAFSSTAGCRCMFVMVWRWSCHFGVILREGSYLGRKFGEQYLSFKRRVRRWL